jgi:flavin reductase (DIM6/NTAB) family NADH-FMN oxidoreductase RutF
MSVRRKRDFPVADVRRYLEPGPVVLVSSAWRGRTNVMTMGWHMVAEFVPSLVACYVWDANQSFGMIRKSRECVINVPTVELVDTVVDIGNCSGRDVDKFAAFGLTPMPARKVRAPLIGECHASFECRLHDGRWIDRHSIFVFEVIAAHVAPRPKHPRTVHYLGDGEFMVAGGTISRRSRFRPDRL